MNTSSRTVRVFLSSTFRDFAEERELLVKNVFPELRRKCRERQVELIDVDLRWGITEKESKQGKVLPICLAEIDRSRPYFIGFLGERYGWVPDAGQYDPSLLIEQPWLDAHRGGKSVTELEILHGVLNKPKMAGQAFFYFRDHKWAAGKGVDYLAGTEDEREKLVALKERIRKSQFPVVENYKNPKFLAERVKDDLWKLIDEAYPVDEVPDALTQERMVHEAYAHARRRLYLGGEGYIAKLSDAMKAKQFRPVLITGQSGGGKSSLLANWVANWRKRNNKAAVIVHHLGAGLDAADPIRLAMRLIREISHITGDKFKPESDPDKQLEKLTEWFAMGSAWAQRTKSELFIVLDGLDKVSERHHLRWFPPSLPPKVKLIASCLDGDILDVARGRLNWQELEVKPFTKTEQKRFIGEYLGRYRKSLTAKQSKTLQSHPLGGNPLFLLTMLEELRVFGIHEQLERRLNELLSPPPSKPQGEAPTVDDVFEHVLSRIEKDIGKKPVQLAMEAICVSRSGLYQHELLAIAKVTPAKWASIQNALDESLYESSGKISFGHDYLRKAVQDRYELTGKRKLNLHRRLAEWFTKQDLDERVAHELPWQWRQGEDYEKLRGFLLNLMNVSAMGKAGILWTEFHHYWRCCGGEAAAQNYLQIIQEVLGGNPTEEQFKRIDILSDFVSKCRWDFTSVKLSRLHLSLGERIYGEDRMETLKVMSRLGINLSMIWSEDAHQEAELLLEKVYTNRMVDLGPCHPETLDAVCDLGTVMSNSRLVSSKSLEQARAYLEDALSMREKTLGENHPDTLTTMNSLSILYWKIRHKNLALKMLSEVHQKVLLTLGDLHPDSLLVQKNLGAMMRDNGDFENAERLLWSTLAKMDSILGCDHRDALFCLQDIGLLYSVQGYEDRSTRVSVEIFRRRGLSIPKCPPFSTI
jgi:nephrocystin-3